MAKKPQGTVAFELPPELLKAFLDGKSVANCFFKHQEMGSVFVLLLADKERLMRADEATGTALADEQFRCLEQLAHTAMAARAPKGQA